MVEFVACGGGVWGEDWVGLEAVGEEGADREGGNGGGGGGSGSVVLGWWGRHVVREGPGQVWWGVDVEDLWLGKYEGSSRWWFAF